MRFRKLRIAWSVVWGVAAVLLIALWVRSYWYWDNIQCKTGQSINSLGGRLLVNQEIGFTRQPWKVIHSGHIFGTSIDWVAFGAANTVRMGNGTAISDWLLVLGSSMIATIPWLRSLKWRFSLRTLLIATTLVAIVLGLIVWSLR